jgi:hypothetical protein
MTPSATAASAQKTETMAMARLDMVGFLRQERPRAAVADVLQCRVSRERGLHMRSFLVIVALFGAPNMAAAQVCATIPAPPAPPAGCASVQPVCGCSTFGECRWTFACVPYGNGAGSRVEFATGNESADAFNRVTRERDEAEMRQLQIEMMRRQVGR